MWFALLHKMWAFVMSSSWHERLITRVEVSISHALVSATIRVLLAKADQGTEAKSRRLCKRKKEEKQQNLWFRHWDWSVLTLCSLSFHYKSKNVEHEAFGDAATPFIAFWLLGMFKFRWRKALNPVIFLVSIKRISPEMSPSRDMKAGFLGLSLHSFNLHNCQLSRSSSSQPY